MRFGMVFVNVFHLVVVTGREWRKILGRQFSWTAVQLRFLLLIFLGIL